MPYKIISIIKNSSKKEEFIIQKQKKFLFFKYWSDEFLYYEKYENGILEQIKFNSFADAEAYLFLKNKGCDRIIKDGNTYGFISDYGYIH